MLKEGRNINNDFSIKDRVVYLYFGKEKNIKIPDGTNIIANSVFTREGLNSVVFPESLTTINSYAFSSNNLKNVEFPSSLSYIGMRSFSHNELTKLTFNQDIIVDCDAFDDNPIHTIRLTENARNIDWKSNERLDTVRILEIASYENHIVFNNLCPNIELLYVDNLPGISLSHFLNKCRLREKKNLRQVHIKNKISPLEKLAIQVVYPKITFLYGDFSKLPEKPIEKDNIPKKNIDAELQERIDKIYQVSALLNEDEKNSIENKIVKLFRNYKQEIEELKPNFGIIMESTLTLESKDINTLRKSLLNDLDTVIFNLSRAENIKKLIEDILQYKKLMYINSVMAPTETESIEDKIRFIIFVHQKGGNKSFKKQLEEILNVFQKRASEEIMQSLEEKSNLSLEADIVTGFERKIQELYDKTKNYQTKVETYQELLDSLELKNDTELSKDIQTALGIINIFYISDKNRCTEILEKIMRNYKNKIKEILFDEEQNQETALEIELDLRRELQPLLEEIHNLSPKTICYNKLKEELKESIKNIYKEDFNETQEGAIQDSLKEIKRLLENEFISEEIKYEIQNRVELCLQKWLHELYENAYQILETMPFHNSNLEISDNIQFELLILKDMLTIQMNVENYITKSVDYQKISAGIISVEENNPFVLKK